MNIAITFRHIDPSEAVKLYAQEKVAKLQRFLRQPMTANVTVALENREHIVEVRVSSGEGHYHGKEHSPDMYASIDLVVDKIERQITGAKSSDHRRGGPKAGEFAAAMADSEE